MEGMGLQGLSRHCAVTGEMHKNCSAQSLASSWTTAKGQLCAHNPIRVWAMLPLDQVNAEGMFKAAPWLLQALQLLAASGVHGVAMDVWWGAVEHQPHHYNWTGYKQLIELVKQSGLKVQAVMSFHACGGNVGDTAQIPLPSWVLQCGEVDPDLFFTDRPREGGRSQRNKEYISIWADEAAGVLCGRSPLQCYEDFMASFAEVFQDELGNTIEEVVVGAGPCGELRYPSYVESNGWRFPGIGEFQCYDRRALASLAAAARDAGRPEWGYGGPHDAGEYMSNPEETGFFSHRGAWDSDYGRFFLAWYSGCLLRHGDQLLSAAGRVFGNKLRPRISQQSSGGGSAADRGSRGLATAPLHKSQRPSMEHGRRGNHQAAESNGPSMTTSVSSTATRIYSTNGSGSANVLSSMPSMGGAPGNSNLGPGAGQRVSHTMLHVAAQTVSRSFMQSSFATLSDGASTIGELEAWEMPGDGSGGGCLGPLPGSSGAVGVLSSSGVIRSSGSVTRGPVGRRNSGIGGMGSMSLMGDGGLLAVRPPSMTLIASSSSPTLQQQQQQQQLQQQQQQLQGQSSLLGQGQGQQWQVQTGPALPAMPVAVPTAAPYIGAWAAAGVTSTGLQYSLPSSSGTRSHLLQQQLSSSPVSTNERAGASVVYQQGFACSSATAVVTTTSSISPADSAAELGNALKRVPGTSVLATVAPAAAGEDHLAPLASECLSRNSRQSPTGNSGGRSSLNGGRAGSLLQQGFMAGMATAVEVNGSSKGAAGDSRSLLGASPAGSSPVPTIRRISADLPVVASYGQRSVDSQPSTGLGSTPEGSRLIMNGVPLYGGGAAAFAAAATGVKDVLSDVVFTSSLPSGSNLLADSDAQPQEEHIQLSCPTAFASPSAVPLATAAAAEAELCVVAGGAADKATRALTAHMVTPLDSEKLTDASSVVADDCVQAEGGVTQRYTPERDSMESIREASSSASDNTTTHANGQLTSMGSSAQCNGSPAGQSRVTEVAGTALSSPGGPDGTAEGSGQQQGFPQDGLVQGQGSYLTLGLKIAGIHWWFRSPSHAAELTAGYYNTATHDGYAAIVELCAKHGAALTLTCVEMCDAQHPAPALCGPEGLLKQIRSLAARHGVPLSGENALPIFLLGGVDAVAMDRIVFNTRAWYAPGAGAAAALVSMGPADGNGGASTAGMGVSKGWGGSNHGSAYSSVHNSLHGSYAAAELLGSPGTAHAHANGNGNPSTGSSLQNALPTYLAALYPPPVYQAGGGGGGSSGGGGLSNGAGLVGCAGYPGLTPPASPLPQHRSNHHILSQRPSGLGITYQTSSFSDTWEGTGASSGAERSSLPAGMGAGSNGALQQHQPSISTSPPHNHHSNGAASNGGTSILAAAALSLSGGGGMGTKAAGITGAGWPGPGMGSLSGSGGMGPPAGFRARSVSEAGRLLGLGIGAGDAGCNGSSSFACLSAACLGMPGEATGVAATGLRTESYADLLQPLPPMSSFTFLRLGPELLSPTYQPPWLRFMCRMQHGGYAPVSSGLL